MQRKEKYQITMDKGDELFLDEVPLKDETELIDTIEENQCENSDITSEIQKEILDMQQIEEIDGKILSYVIEMMKGDLSNTFWDEMLNTLEKAYMSGYRHSYHKISLTIYQNQNMNDYTLDNMLNNINTLQGKMYLENQGKKELFSGIKKLCDHIQLEIVRINSNKSSIDEVKSLISEFEDKAENSIDKLKATTDEQKRGMEKRIAETIVDVEKKTKSAMENTDDIRNNLVGQVVAILGVFAAIVLAFTGGMAFSSSALENINKSSAYRIVIICLIIGFTFFNTITALVLYLDRLVFRITRREKEDNETKKRFLWNKVKRNFLWIVTDTIFIICMFIVNYKWEHSSEKEMQDASNQYQIEVHQKNTEELNQISISGNGISEVN